MFEEGNFYAMTLQRQIISPASVFMELNLIQEGFTSQIHGTLELGLQYRNFEKAMNIYSVNSTPTLCQVQF